MSGLKSGLAAVVLVSALGSSAHAQAFVPGGWAMQFGYQPLGGGVAMGGGGFYGPSVGFGMSTAPMAYPGYGVYGGGMGVTPYGAGVVPFGAGTGPAYNGGVLPGIMPPPAQTYNGTNALIGAIRQTTRKPGRR